MCMGFLVNKMNFSPFIPSIVSITILYLVLWGTSEQTDDAPNTYRFTFDCDDSVRCHFYNMSYNFPPNFRFLDLHFERKIKIIWVEKIRKKKISNKSNTILLWKKKVNLYRYLVCLFAT